MNTEATRYLSEEELIQKALEALMAVLGPVEAIRFLALTREGRVESVKRHQQWQTILNRNEFLDNVFGEVE